jgi:hypothetical protein
MISATGVVHCKSLLRKLNLLVQQPNRGRRGAARSVATNATAPRMISNVIDDRQLAAYSVEKLHREI